VDDDPQFLLDDDGLHVWFKHQCGSGTSTTMLPRPPWFVLSPLPLTVAPSVHCKRCGTHGFITDGKWVAA
jgi:hypothetical protein